jgi:putative transcriptional regulator
VINFSMTDKAITTEIGRRLNSLRLKRNVSQKELAERSGLSLKAIHNAEKGESKLITYIKLLRELDSLDTLESFIPEVKISPMQVAKMAGEERRRATGERKKE